MEWCCQSGIFEGMKGVNSFNTEDWVSNERPGDLRGKINATELRDTPEYAKITHARNSCNWYEDGGKENLPPRQGGPSAITSPLGKRCSLGKNGIPEGYSEVSGLFTGESGSFLCEYVDCLATDAAELQALRTTVKELRLRDMRSEGEVVECYRLQEQEKAFVEMEQRLLEQTAKISDLEAQRKSLLEKIAVEKKWEKDLDCARAEIRELQEQIHLEAEQSAAELMELKQKISLLEAKEDESVKRDFLVERKLQSLQDLEIEVVELRRTCKELQQHKRELSIKLNEVTSQPTHSSNANQRETVSQAEADAIALLHVNEDLCRQLEALQNDRFSEVEELIYLRWVNACLRHELRSFQSTNGKFTAADLNKNLSPKSQAMAKQLMLEYARPDITIQAKEQIETGYENAVYDISSPSESAGDYSESSDFLGSWRLSKKPGFIHQLKKWTGSGKALRKGRNTAYDLLTGSPSVQQGRTPTHPIQSGGTESKNFLKRLTHRNSSETGGIGFCAVENVGIESPDGYKSSWSVGVSQRSESTFSDSRIHYSPVSMRKLDDDSMNEVATSFQLMSTSVSGTDISEKYPSFRDRHRGPTEREKMVKETEDEQVTIVKANSEPEAGNASVMVHTGAKQIKAFPMACRSKEQEVKPDGVVTKRVETSKIAPAKVETRAKRIPKPPPRPSGLPPDEKQVSGKARGMLPPPPPPPLFRSPPGAPPPPSLGSLKVQDQNKAKMQRVPEVVQFYQSLMKRDARKESISATNGVAKNTEARSNMIGEIANRSTHLLAIKADVETQKEFVESLATEVRSAAFTNMEDVVAFVGWLDEELSFLVDERAVLKHFDWPEGKADALREAAFEYQDLGKLQQKVAAFEDRSELPCEVALSRMLAAQEKMEKSVYKLLRGRDLTTTRYKEFGIPTQWMLDSGLVGQIKLAAVRIARLYMKRTASELDLLSATSEKEPLLEFLLLQGVQFAFRVHQFAGGFDAESMAAFQALRNRAHLGNNPKP